MIMGRKKFFVGNIVRKKTASGIAVGPFMKIMHITNSKIYADIIGLDEPNVVLQKKDVVPMKCYSLPVSKKQLDRLKQGKIDRICHPVSIRWQSAYEKTPDLIRFYALEGAGDSGVFTIDSINKRLSLNEPVIEIVIARQLL